MRPQDMPEALAAGSISAFAASEPTPSLAEMRGAREVATLGNLDNCYPILILARKEMLEKRPDDIRRFLQALVRATDFIREHPGDTAERLGAATGLAPEVARKAMGRHTFSLSLQAPIIDSLEKTALFLLEQKVIDRIPDLSAAVDACFLPD